MPLTPPPEPWHSFLQELDAAARGETWLDCAGGFVITLLYGLTRPTADVDVLSIAPQEQRESILGAAGRGSLLHKKYGLYLDYVTVATLPENYQERRVEMFPGGFQHLRLLALDPYDLALAKLERNSQRDRDDVKHLARTVRFDLGVLRERYEQELRPYLASPQREDLTLQLWIEAIEEERTQTP